MDQNEIDEYRKSELARHEAAKPAMAGEQNRETMNTFEATVLLPSHTLETPIRIDAHDMAGARQKLTETLAHETVDGWLEWYDEVTKTSLRLKVETIVGYQIRQIEPPAAQDWIA